MSDQYPSFTLPEENIFASFEDQQGSDEIPILVNLSCISTIRDATHLDQDKRPTTQLHMKNGSCWWVNGSRGDILEIIATAFKEFRMRVEARG
jgi:hypothetical protein